MPRIRILSQLLLVSSLAAQAALSGNSLWRYGETRTGYLYSENLLNVNLALGALHGWLQMEVGDPPELGRRFRGLRKYRLEYRTDQTTLKAGDLYEIWGRGLILNQFDNQPVDFDNSITGAGLDYRSKYLQGQILAGNSDQWESTIWVMGFDDRVPNYQRHYDLVGASFEVPWRSLSLGMAGLDVREEHPIPFNEFFVPDTIPLKHAIRGGRLAYSLPALDAYTEYVSGRTRLITDPDTGSTLINRGFGFYGNVNLYLGTWSLSLDVKKYDFLALDPDRQSNLVENYGGVVAFQRGPIVMREQATRLLNRVSHQIDYNDEVGYQLEFTGPVGQDLTLVLQHARASRNDWWTLDSMQVWNKYKQSRALPFSDPAAQPFEEWYLELDGYFLDDRLHVTAGYGSTFESAIPRPWYVISGTQVIRVGRQYEMHRAHTFPLSLGYLLDGGWNVDLKLEYQELTKGMVYDSTAADRVRGDRFESFFHRPEQYNTFTSLTVSRSPGWSFSVILDAISVDEKSVIPAEPTLNPLEKWVLKRFRLRDLERRWLSVELVWNITAANRLTLMYGSQQGGLLCSNGVCRFIEAFEDGFKVELASLF